MRILRSARKHGVEDADIRHAVKYTMRDVDQRGGVLIVIGPARNGALLEIGIADVESDVPRVIHAMPLRAAWYRYL